MSDAAAQHAIDCAIQRARDAYLEHGDPEILERAVEAALTCDYSNILAELQARGLVFLDRDKRPF